jgi:predicted transcriptional regulator
MILVVVNTTTLAKNLGLTPNELKVFEGFTLHPGVSAAKMSGILHMDKSSTYRSVNNLVEFGLLLQRPANDVMTYTAADPEELNGRFSERLTELTSTVPLLNSFINSLASRATRKTHIRTETGIEAVQKTLKESLDCKEKLIRELYRTHSFFHNSQHVQFVLEMTKQRIKKGIFIRQFAAVHPEYEVPEIKKVMKNKPELLKEIHILPPELDDMNSLRIWDNTTTLHSEDEKGEPLVVTITDPYITGFMKRIYDFVWNQSERID